MTAIELKRYLNSHQEYIVNILEDLGCDKINISHKDRISCCAIGGDNENSVQIWLNDNLNCDIYTRSKFQEYEIKDIISMVQFFRQCTLIESMNYIMSVCGIPGGITYDNNEQSDTLSFLRKFKKTINTKDLEEDFTILEESELDNYLKCGIKQWEDDFVDIDIQEEFGIRYDLADNRVIIPIRNGLGELVSIKGRSLYPDWKERGLYKFVYYHNISSRSLLYGEYENKEYIKRADEIICVEAEKGVQQLASFGIRNVVAVSKKHFTRQQINKLLSFGKPIVIAFDKDASEYDIRIECRNFRGLISTSYIYDWMGMMQEKQSPMDNGNEIWNQLYISSKFEYKED